MSHLTDCIYYLPCQNEKVLNFHRCHPFDLLCQGAIGRHQLVEHVPDRHVQEKVLEVMVHHEGVIKEDCSIGDIGDSDQIPDNVLEEIMRAPHLDQVLCLL